MKKIPINKQYFTIACYVVAVVVVCVLFEKAAGNITIIGGWVGGVIRGALSVLSPFVYGGIIAFTINSVVKSLEKNVLSRIPKVREKKGLKRALSIVICYIIVIGGITWIIIYLIPELTKNITNMALSVTSWFNSSNLYVDGSLIDEWVDWANSNFSTNLDKAELINTILKPIMDFISGLPTYAQTVVSGAISAASVALNFLLGMVIAFYMLCEKETYSEFAKKLCFLTLKRERANRVIEAAKVANKTFEQFIIGMAVDSLVVGVLLFIVCIVLNVRYAPLLAIILGVMNMVPYFGPFIGGGIVALIVMTYSVPMALWMILIIFIIMQLDANIIQPKILGDSLGLKPIGVIFSIFVGGWLAGVPGMFFGVPLFTVIWAALTTFVNRKYEEGDPLAAAHAAPPPDITEEAYIDDDEEPSPIDAQEDFDRTFDYSSRRRIDKRKERPDDIDGTRKKN